MTALLELFLHSVQQHHCVPKMSNVGMTIMEVCMFGWNRHTCRCDSSDFRIFGSSQTYKEANEPITMINGQKLNGARRKY